MAAGAVAPIAIGADTCQVHIVLSESKTPVALFGVAGRAGAQQNAAATASLLQVLLQFARDVDDGVLDVVFFGQPEAALVEGTQSIQHLSPIAFERHRRASSVSELPTHPLALVAARAGPITVGVVARVASHPDTALTPTRGLAQRIAAAFIDRYASEVQSLQTRLQETGVPDDQLDQLQRPFDAFKDSLLL